MEQWSTLSESHSLSAEGMMDEDKQNRRAAICMRWSLQNQTFLAV